MVCGGFTAHVLVLHVFEVAQLSVRPLGVDGSLEGPSQLLQSHPYIVLLVQRRAAAQQRASHPKPTTSVYNSHFQAKASTPHTLCSDKINKPQSQQDKGFSSSPDGAISASAYGDQVLVAYRHLPHRLKELQAVVAIPYRLLRQGRRHFVNLVP